MLYITIQHIFFDGRVLENILEGLFLSIGPFDFCHLNCFHWKMDSFGFCDFERTLQNVVFRVEISCYTFFINFWGHIPVWENVITIVFLVNSRNWTNFAIVVKLFLANECKKTFLTKKWECLGFISYKIKLQKRKCRFRSFEIWSILK